MLLSDIWTTAQCNKQPPSSDTPLVSTPISHVHFSSKPAACSSTESHCLPVPHDNTSSANNQSQSMIGNKAKARHRCHFTTKQLVRFQHPHPLTGNHNYLHPEPHNSSAVLLANPSCHQPHHSYHRLGDFKKPKQPLFWPLRPASCCCCCCCSASLIVLQSAEIVRTVRFAAAAAAPPIAIA
jgi:hypothetical protein